jgi:hypothetical protein
MDSEEDDGPDTPHWTGEYLAAALMAPHLSGQEPNVIMFALGHLMGMFLSAFPDAEREEPRRLVLMYADSTASRLRAEREVDRVLAAFKRRNDAQKELDEILTAAKRRLDDEQ